MCINTGVFDEKTFTSEVELDNVSTFFVYHHELFSYIPKDISILPNDCKHMTLRRSI